MAITISPDETKNPSGARPTIPEGGTVPRPVTIDLGLQARDGKLGQPVAPQPKPIPEMEKQQMNAYAQGFVQKCAEAGVEPMKLAQWAERANTQPSRLGAQLATNPMSTVMSGGLLPFLYGAARPGSDNPMGGGLKGLGGALGGIPLGGVIGGAGGATAGLGISGLAALLTMLATKGKLPPGELSKLLQLGAGGGGATGAMAGAALGPGELSYRLLRDKQTPRRTA